MLKYLHTALERFATPQKAQFQRVQFCLHVAGINQWLMYIETQA